MEKRPEKQLKSIRLLKKLILPTVYWDLFLYGLTIMTISFLICLLLVSFALISENWLEINIIEIISAIVLWYTAVIIFYYTEETSLLKAESKKQNEISIRQTELSVQPLIVFRLNEYRSDKWLLKNIGNGSALNIRVLKSTIDKDKFSREFHTLNKDPQTSPILCLEREGIYSEVRCSIDWYNETIGILEDLFDKRGEEKYDLEFFIWVYYENLFGNKFASRHRVKEYDRIEEQINDAGGATKHIGHKYQIIETTFIEKMDAGL